jgi:ribose 5-phosphate isomerase RpiB
MMDRETIRQIVREVLGQSMARTPPAKREPATPLRTAAASGRPPSRPVISADDINRLAKNGAAIDLPKSAIITPLARDIIAQKKLTVRLLDATAEPPPSSAAAPAAVALACDQTTVAVREIINAAARDHLPVSVLEPELPAAIDQIARSLRAGKIRGAVLLVQEPCFALCYANKLKGIRAAPAGDYKCIQRAIDTINANVFVIDCPGRGFYQLWQLVRTFVQLRMAARKPGSHQPQIEGKET